MKTMLFPIYIVLTAIYAQLQGERGMAALLQFLAALMVLFLVIDGWIDAYCKYLEKEK